MSYAISVSGKTLIVNGEKFGECDTKAEAKTACQCLRRILKQKMMSPLRLYFTLFGNRDKYFNKEELFKFIVHSALSTDDKYEIKIKVPTMFCDCELHDNYDCNCEEQHLSRGNVYSDLHYQGHKIELNSLCIKEIITCLMGSNGCRNSELVVSVGAVFNVFHYNDIDLINQKVVNEENRIRDEFKEAEFERQRQEQIARDEKFTDEKFTLLIIFWVVLILGGWLLSSFFK